MQAILQQLSELHPITSVEFFGIFEKLCSTRNTNIDQFLGGKSFIFKYVEFIKENDQLKQFDIGKLQAKYYGFVNLIINSDFDENKIFDGIVELMIKSNYQQTNLMLLDFGIHIIKSIIPKNIDEKYYMDYIYFKYMFDRMQFKKEYYYYDVFNDDELLKKICAAYLNLTDHNKLLYSHVLTPKMYEYLLLQNVKFEDLRYSNGSNLLLFIAERGSIEMLNYLVNVHHYDINYKND